MEYFVYTLDNIKILTRKNFTSILQVEKLILCDRGGTGIRARLRGVSERVRVRFPSIAPNKALEVKVL